MSELAFVYFKNGSVLKSATTSEKAYNVIEDIPALWYFTMTVIDNIIAAYLVACNCYKARQWIQVLKRKAILTCGTWKAIEAI